MSALHSWKVFSLHKLKTFKNCKEAKLNMIIALIYIFLSYVIFDEQLKINFRKSSGHPLKNPLPLFIEPAPQPPENLTIFNLQKGGGGGREHYVSQQWKH